jgi:hypothetical protein
MRILEITPENRAALLLGLEYLIGISYVDDTEVFKVGMLKYICPTNTMLVRPPYDTGKFTGLLGLLECVCLRVI